MKRRVIYIVNLIVAFGLAALTVWSVRPWEVWKFDNTFVTAAGLSLVVNMAIVWLWANRHALVVRATGTDIPPRHLMGLVTFSNAANNLTPAATGEIVRGWFLNRRFGVPIEDAAVAIVFERVFMFGLMVLTAIGAGALATDHGWVAVAALALIAIYVFVLPSLLRPLSSRAQKAPTEKRGRVLRVLRAVMTGGISLWSSRRVTVGMTLWSLGTFSSMGFIFWLSARSTELVLEPAQVWALVGGATVIGVLSFLPFGLGAAELSAVGIAFLIGVSAQEVTAAFVVYRLLFTLPMALAGSWAYARLTRMDRGTGI